MQSGNRRAIEAFFCLHLPELRRWARRRVPRWLERRADADDFVQLAALRTLRRLPHLSPKQLDAIQPYMRRTVINLVRDELRVVGRSPETIAIDDRDLATTSTALDALMGQATWKSYRAALKALRARDRTAVVARIQLGESYEAIATRIGAPSTAAARVAVGRAIHRLVGEMSARLGDLPRPRKTIGRRRSATAARPRRPAWARPRR